MRRDSGGQAGRIGKPGERDIAADPIQESTGGPANTGPRILYFCSGMNSSVLLGREFHAMHRAVGPGTRQSNSQGMSAMKLRTKRLSQLPSYVKEVEAWQRYLKSKGVYSGSPNGSFDAATDAATEKYRQKTYLRGDDVFVMSFEQPDREYSRSDSDVDLTSSIKGVLTKIAYGYYILTGRELEVTSGKRPPEKQAALMREKAQYGERPS